MPRKTLLAVSIALVAALMLSGIAYAITIAIDGVKESTWDTGSGGQVPGDVPDANESTIQDGRDMQDFKYTNDTTNMYFLMQTYINAIYTGNPVPTLIICLDVDNDASTGGAYTNCNSMNGIDRSIIVTRFGIDVYDGDPNNGTLIDPSSAAYARSGLITEMSIPLTELGITDGTTCINGMRMAVYFDGGTTDPDDNAPDNGTVAISCGTPTAVDFSLLQARPTTSPVVPVALIGVSAVALISVVFLTRRKKTA